MLNLEDRIKLQIGNMVLQYLQLQMQNEELVAAIAKMQPPAPIPPPVPTEE